MPEPLERRYRRLLLAYPARYRRLRGLEMLTTLMDLAPAGRRWPSPGEALYLVFGGLRCHFSLRGAPWPVALLTAVFIAVLGSAGGALAGWRLTNPALPSNQDAIAVAHTADPRMPGQISSQRDFLFGYDVPVREHEKVLVALLGGDEYTAGYRHFYLKHPADGYATLKSARDRLQASGWHTSAIEEEAYGAHFTAHRDGLFLNVQTAGERAQHVTSLWIKRATPVLVQILTVAGLLLGAMAGWQLGGWAARRLRQQLPVRKALAATAFLFGSLLLIESTVFNLIEIAGSLGTAEPASEFIGFVFILVRGMLGFSLLLAALVMAVLPGRSRSLLTA